MDILQALLSKRLKRSYKVQLHRNIYSLEDFNQFDYKLDPDFAVN
jgi:hypothetical protein